MMVNRRVLPQCVLQKDMHSMDANADAVVVCRVDVSRLDTFRAYCADDTDNYLLIKQPKKKSKNNNDEIVPHAICAVAPSQSGPNSKNVFSSFLRLPKMRLAHSEFSIYFDLIAEGENSIRNLCKLSYKVVELFVGVVQSSGNSYDRKLLIDDDSR